MKAKQLRDIAQGRNKRVGFYRKVKRIRYKILTDQSSNAKLAKNSQFGIYLSAILHLAPHMLSGRNFCPFASKGCIEGCLNTAGRGGIQPKDGRLNSIQKARIRRSQLFTFNRAAFWRLLKSDLEKIVRLAQEYGLIPCVRLNGTSDLMWEKIRFDGKTVFEHFPQIQFYDYTKAPYDKRPTYLLPPNYHLTMSMAEDNLIDCEKALDNGRNVVCVVKVKKGHPLPIGYGDADIHDLRFLDGQGKNGQGRLMAVRAKGKAKNDTSGFALTFPNWRFASVQAPGLTQDKEIDDKLKELKKFGLVNPEQLAPSALV